MRRRTLLVLGGGLGAGGVALMLIPVLDRQQPVTLPFVLGIFLLLFAVVLLLDHYFARRKAAESDRLELEQRLSFLVQHIKDYAIFLIDPEGRVMSWNKGAEQIKGYTEAEILGKPISIFYTEEDNQRGEPFLNLKRALDEGRYESVGLRKRKDGTIFFADVVFTPIYDDRGGLKGFIKITRDITEQKKAEEDMLSTLQREKELNEMKSRFVTLASHEFKTPLSVILSSVSLIEKYPETEQQDKRLKHIHRIKSNVANLRQILNDFLSLEKLEVGIIKNEPAQVNPAEIVRETVLDLEPSLKEGQQIRLHSDGRTRFIELDAQLLRNVLNNLLSNAIKYSPEQGEIDCRLHFRPDALEIEIRDQGIGIPPEEQEHLFERFFRASNSTGIPGTGLGLSIVKKYLDLMGGRIGLVSIPWQGTTVTVTLPAGDPFDHNQREG
ncbi:MAG: PAS domain-containing sensor histidine kinase [Bacteroidota bacterium]|nr:PAS domain-containing sensor histidine kinase [Bacteroidota bacterium]MDP4245600.1 PAS domain-containing sensor histidine kinase [Bacteroidota bacterium]MDP4253676.1 PAS domain-containing sensor histidine kinase [Bacteroidota bacterium]MDP4259572.1 PAS domain-containing sensor histidine kinase [Bacteroidota bacterium]